MAANLKHHKKENIIADFLPFFFFFFFFFHSLLDAFSLQGKKIINSRVFFLLFQTLFDSQLNYSGRILLSWLRR